MRSCSASAFGEDHRNWMVPAGAGIFAAEDFGWFPGISRRGLLICSPLVSLGEWQIIAAPRSHVTSKLSPAAITTRKTRLEGGVPRDAQGHVLRDDVKGEVDAQG